MYENSMDVSYMDICNVHIGGLTPLYVCLHYE
jgi:hypothetical protein